MSPVVACWGSVQNVRPATEQDSPHPDGTTVQQMWITWDDRQFHVTVEGRYPQDMLARIVGNLTRLPGQDPNIWPSSPLATG